MHQTKKCFFSRLIYQLFTLNIRLGRSGPAEYCTQWESPQCGWNIFLMIPRDGRVFKIDIAAQIKINEIAIGLICMYTVYSLEKPISLLNKYKWTSEYKINRVTHKPIHITKEIFLNKNKKWGTLICIFF